MLNVAIDGHSGSGKSSLARGIADKMGFKVLNTGAIYRGLACAFRESGFAEVNKETIEKFVSKTTVKVEFVENKQYVIVNNKDYTQWLRLEEISSLASLISPYQILRNKVVDIQRDFAKNNDCIVEGRDIGTEVLPNAKIKFFVTASEEVRAKRRYEQIQNKEGTSLEQILADLRERDYKDEHREVAPLKKAPDSITIDNSNMTLEETVDYCINIIKEKTKT